MSIPARKNRYRTDIVCSDGPSKVDNGGGTFVAAKRSANIPSDAERKENSLILRTTVPKMVQCFPRTFESLAQRAKRKLT